jgi:hypothetical protein
MGADADFAAAVEAAEVAAALAEGAGAGAGAGAGTGAGDGAAAAVAAAGSAAGLLAALSTVDANGSAIPASAGAASLWLDGSLRALIADDAAADTGDGETMVAGERANSDDGPALPPSVGLRGAWGVKTDAFCCAGGALLADGLELGAAGFPPKKENRLVFCAVAGAFAAAALGFAAELNIALCRQNVIGAAQQLPHVYSAGQTKCFCI